MIKKKYLAPNIITAGNMFLGYLSIIESFKGNYLRAVVFIILAMICDGLDGKAARKFTAFSEFGKEFDSFSDAISFGVAPSLFALSILNQYGMNSIAMPIAFLYALCGVMRLVKFNVINTASSEKGDFSGMPIPNAAGMVISYYLINYYLEKYFGINFFDVNIFMVVTVIAAMLMVSTIPFKTPDKTFKFIPHKYAVPFIIICLVGIIFSLFILTYAYTLINLCIFLHRVLSTNKKNKSSKLIESDEEDYYCDCEEDCDCEESNSKENN